MERTFDIQLWSLDQARIVDIEVIYIAHEDIQTLATSIGVQFFRPTFQLEIKSISATLENKQYVPSDEDLKMWSKDIEREMERDFHGLKRVSA